MASVSDSFLVPTEPGYPRWKRH